jgi:hypothetical protein
VRQRSIAGHPIAAREQLRDKADQGRQLCCSAPAQMKRYKICC